MVGELSTSLFQYVSLWKKIQLPVFTFNTRVSNLEKHIQAFRARLGVLQVGVRNPNLALLLSRADRVDVVDNVGRTTEIARIAGEIKLFRLQAPAEVAATVNSALDNDHFIL